MNELFGGCSGFFRCQPSEIGKEQRLMYIAIRTDDGRNIGKISFYCNTLSADRHFTMILNVRANPGSISRLLTPC